MVFQPWFPEVFSMLAIDVFMGQCSKIRIQQLLHPQKHSIVCPCVSLPLSAVLPVPFFWMSLVSQALRGHVLFTSVVGIALGTQRGLSGMRKASLGMGHREARQRL